MAVYYTIVDFALECKTQMGESVFIIGDHSDLGEWAEADGMALKTDEKAYPIWSLEAPWLVELPEGTDETSIRYKVCIKKDGEKPRFEEIKQNRRLLVTAGAAGMSTTLVIKFGEDEKEPARIPKFRPPPRKSGLPKPGSEASVMLSQVASTASMTSGMKSVMSTASVGLAMTHLETGCGLDFRLQAALECGKEISFWHDIPLFPMSETNEPIPFQANFVCEIPKTTRKKFEVCTKGVGNPIKQDTKNGKLREYSKGDVWFNYGCLPRTWEDTEFVHPDVGFPGDGDPLDACEIGARMFKTGEVRQTKVLGVICMIDEDETDWKLICIDVEDRWAPELNDIDDVEQLLPGALSQIREWWRTYKVTDGKPLNKFGLDEKFMPAKYAMEVVVECHEAWKRACAKASEAKPMGKNLSFSKLSELDLATDEVALKTLAGA